MTKQLPPSKHGPLSDALAIVAVAGVLAIMLEIYVPSSESFEVFVSLLVVLFGYSILNEVWREKQ